MGLGTSPESGGVWGRVPEGRHDQPGLLVGFRLRDSPGSGTFVVQLGELGGF